MVQVLYYPSNKRKRIPVSNIQIPSEPIHMIDWWEVPTIEEVLAEQRAKKSLPKPKAADEIEDEKKSQADEKVEEDSRHVLKLESLSKPDVVLKEDSIPSSKSVTVSPPRLDIQPEGPPEADLVIAPLNPKPLSPKRVIEPVEVKREKGASTTNLEKSIPSHTPSSEKSVPKQRTVAEKTVPETIVAKKTVTETNVAEKTLPKQTTVAEKTVTKTKIKKKTVPKKKKNTLAPKKKKREQSIADIKNERKTEEDFLARAAHELRFWKAKLKQEASEAAHEEERRAKARRKTASRLRWWDSMIGIRNHEVCWLREDTTLKRKVKARPLKLMRRNSPRTVPISKTQLDEGFAREEYMSSDLLKSMSKIRQKMERSERSPRKSSPKKSGNKAFRYQLSTSNRKSNPMKTKTKPKAKKETLRPGDQVSAKMLHKIGDWISLTPSPPGSVANSPSSRHSPRKFLHKY